MEAESQYSRAEARRKVTVRNGVRILARSGHPAAERQTLRCQGAAKLLERVWPYPVEALDFRLADGGQLC